MPFLNHWASEIQFLCRLGRVGCPKCHQWLPPSRQSVFNAVARFSTCLSHQAAVCGTRRVTVAGAAGGGRGGPAAARSRGRCFRGLTPRWDGDSARRGTRGQERVRNWRSVLSRTTNSCGRRKGKGSAGRWSRSSSHPARLRWGRLVTGAVPAVRAASAAAPRRWLLFTE